MEFNEADPEYQKVLESKNAKKYFMSAEEMKDDKTNKEYALLYIYF